MGPRHGSSVAYRMRPERGRRRSDRVRLVALHSRYRNSSRPPDSDGRYGIAGGGPCPAGRSRVEERLMAPRPPAFTLGVEEEFQLIDPQTRELRSHIHQLLAASSASHLVQRMKPELHQSIIELGTGICKAVGE